MMLQILSAGSGGFIDSVKSFVNAASKPEPFLTLCTVAFILMFVLYRWWTKPKVFAVIFGLFMLGYFGSMADANFRKIVAKPDNVPITMMVITVFIFLWISFRRAALNDERTAAGMPLLEEDRDDKVLVWPDLVYTE